MVAKKKRGRPLEYDTELALKFCEEIGKGKTMTEVLEENPEWPRAGSWHHWNVTVPEFTEIYAIAKRNQVCAMVDYIIKKSKDDSRDVIEDEVIFEKDGEMIHKVVRKSDNTAVQRDRLIVDTLKWYACKVYPKVYGEKIQQEVTGAEGGPFKPILEIHIEK